MSANTIKCLPRAYSAGSAKTEKQNRPVETLGSILIHVLPHVDCKH